MNRIEKNTLRIITYKLELTHNDKWNVIFYECERRQSIQTISRYNALLYHFVSVMVRHIKLQKKNKTNNQHHSYLKQQQLAAKLFLFDIYFVFMTKWYKSFCTFASYIAEYFIHQVLQIVTVLNMNNVKILHTRASQSWQGKCNVIKFTKINLN